MGVDQPPWHSARADIVEDVHVSAFPLHVLEAEVARRKMAEAINAGKDLHTLFAGYMLDAGFSGQELFKALAEHVGPEQVLHPAWGAGYDQLEAT